MDYVTFHYLGNKYLILELSDCLTPGSMRVKHSLIDSEAIITSVQLLHNLCCTYTNSNKSLIMFIL